MENSYAVRCGVTYMKYYLAPDSELHSAPYTAPD